MDEALFILGNLWTDYIRHALDVFISAFAIYKIFTLIEGTRSIQVLKGILFLLLVTVFADMLDFVLLGWMIRWFWVVGGVALVIVFQPEIRSFLAHLGSGRLTRVLLKSKAEFIDEIIDAMKKFSRRGCGALIVLEQDTGLKDYLETGVRINSEISSELLVTIFCPKAPLHDGAVIISGERIMAAGCILPLTHNPSVSKILGTRHRAAIGLSEITDALVLVASEETGEYSMAKEGTLKQDMELEEIRNILMDYYRNRISEAQATRK
ncbi:MAG: diadenylate cyclase CdaA [Elusimicrobiota bacterium]